jgi:hypothetical protein
MVTQIHTDSRDDIAIPLGILRVTEKTSWRGMSFTHILRDEHTQEVQEVQSVSSWYRARSSEQADTSAMTNQIPKKADLALRDEAASFRS